MVIRWPEGMPYEMTDATIEIVRWRMMSGEGVYLADIKLLADKEGGMQHQLYS